MVLEDYCIFVGDLTPEVDDSMLYLYFALKYPSCTGVKIIRDILGVSRGFGFVRFENIREKEKAMAENNGRYGLGQKPLKINEAFQKISTGIPDMTYLLNQYKIQHPHLYFNPVAPTPLVIQKPAKMEEYEDEEMNKFYKSVKNPDQNDASATTKELAKESAEESNNNQSKEIDPSKPQGVSNSNTEINPNVDLFDAESLQRTANFYNAQNTTVPIIPLTRLNPNLKTLDPAYQYYHYQLMQRQNAMYNQSGLFQPEPLKAPNIYPVPQTGVRENPNDLISYYSNPNLTNIGSSNPTAYLLNHLGLVNSNIHTPGTTSGSLMRDRMNEEFMNAQHGELFEAIERSRWQPIDFQSNNFIALDF